MTTFMTLLVVPVYGVLHMSVPVGALPDRYETRSRDAVTKRDHPTCKGKVTSDLHYLTCLNWVLFVNTISPGWNSTVITLSLRNVSRAACEV